MAKMAKTIDAFTQHQTRLAVVIDSLDSCEQDKVLQMLDTVRFLEDAASIEKKKRNAESVDLLRVCPQHLSHRLLSLAERLSTLRFA